MRLHWERPDRDAFAIQSPTMSLMDLHHWTLRMARLISFTALLLKEVQSKAQLK